MTSRHTLKSLGRSRRRVRVYVDRKRNLTSVSWYEGRRRRVESWPNTKAGRAEAIAYAKGRAHEMATGTMQQAESTPLTLRQLWGLYKTAAFPTLRPRTQELYEMRWKRFELFLGSDFPADRLTLQNVDELRAALVAAGTALNQVRAVIGVAKIVYRWAQRRELIQNNRLALYQFKVPRGVAVQLAPAEYRREEFESLLAQFNYCWSNQWRPWAMLMLLGHQGVRFGNARRLCWTDVDWESGNVRWIGENEKTGRTWSQPLTWGGLTALLTADWWRRHDGYGGPWVFYSSHQGRGESLYTAQALSYALHRAETAAGITHQKFRGVHGLRRMVSGDLLAATGDPKLAMDFTGHTGLGEMTKYLKLRDDRLRDAADVIDRVTTEVQP